MKFGKLYTDLTSVKREDNGAPVEAKTSPAEDATRAQARANWISSTITQEMVSDIREEIGRLLQDSVILATNATPDSPNAQNIIKNLVRVDTLNKQLDKYTKL